MNVMQNLYCPFQDQNYRNLCKSYIARQLSPKEALLDWVQNPDNILSNCFLKNQILNKTPQELCNLFREIFNELEQKHREERYEERKIYQNIDSSLQKKVSELAISNAEITNKYQNLCHDFHNQVLLYIQNLQPFQQFEQPNIQPPIIPQEGDPQQQYQQDYEIQLQKMYYQQQEQYQHEFEEQYQSLTQVYVRKNSASDKSKNNINHQHQQQIEEVCKPKQTYLVNDSLNRKKLKLQQQQQLQQNVSILLLKQDQDMQPTTLQEQYDQDIQNYQLQEYSNGKLYTQMQEATYQQNAMHIKGCQEISQFS